jgi:hypothetical protein
MTEKSVMWVQRVNNNFSRPKRQETTSSVTFAQLHKLTTFKHFWDLKKFTRLDVEKR